MTVLSASLTIGITVNFTFRRFFGFHARSRFSCLFSFSFSYTLESAWMAKHTVRHVLFFFGSVSLGLVSWPRMRDPSVSQKPEYIVSLIFQNIFQFEHVPFAQMVKFWTSMHNSQCTIFPCQSSLVLYVFCANLIQALIMGEVSLVCSMKWPYTFKFFFFLVIFIPSMLVLSILFLVALISLLR